VIKMRNRTAAEPVDPALRFLLEARQDRARIAERVSARSRRGDADDWRMAALEQLADSVLFIARENQTLQDEIRSLRDEIRRLRSRLLAAA
jgi:predicted RNase H-like nuclease (RuvC/YqgF family)